MSNYIFTDEQGKLVEFKNFTSDLSNPDMYAGKQASLYAEELSKKLNKKIIAWVKVAKSS